MERDGMHIHQLGWKVKLSGRAGERGAASDWEGGKEEAKEKGARKEGRCGDVDEDEDPTKEGGHDRITTQQRGIQRTTIDKQWIGVLKAWCML